MSSSHSLCFGGDKQSSNSTPRLSPTHEKELKMANRRFVQFRNSLEKKVVDLFFQVTIAAAGAPTLVMAASKGIASIARNSAGQYTVTLSDAYVGLLDMDITDLNAAGIPVSPNMGIISDAVNVKGGGTVVFQLSAAGTATDPASGDVLLGRLTLKDSTAF